MVSVLGASEVEGDVHEFHQAFPGRMQGIKIKLLFQSDCGKCHLWTRRGFRNGRRITGTVLVNLHIGTDMER